MARCSDDLLARFHAIWTLEGLGALDARLVRDAMEDTNPRLRIQALRASETLYKAGDKTFADDYRRMTKDADANVAIQAMLSASLFKLKDLPELVKATQASNSAKGVAIIGDRLLAPPPATLGGRRGGSLTPAEEKRLQQGSDVFNAVCFSCHGPDALGAPLDGAAPGTTMAPPLAGSPRVQAHRDYVIKVLLRGMTGTLDGKSYRDVMVPMDNTDEWVAGVASFVRTSFGNTGDLVTPADVVRVRAEIAAKKGPWTIDELESSLPRVIDAQTFTVTASHGADTASYAATLRGWSSGAALTPGMWFLVELPRRLVSEPQLDPRRPADAAAPREPAPAPALSPARGARVGAAPTSGYPRVLRDGVDGREEVEQAGCAGHGRRRAHDDHSLRTRAFVRIRRRQHR
jgi:mono/diheme cytochrome c family protein